MPDKPKKPTLTQRVAALEHAPHDASDLTAVMERLSALESPTEAPTIPEAADSQIESRLDSMNRAIELTKALQEILSANQNKMNTELQRLDRTTKKLL